MHAYEKSFIEKCFFTLQRQCTLVYSTFFFYNSTKIAFLQVAQLTYMTKVSQGLAILSDENSKGLITYLILSGEAAAKRVNTSITRRGCKSLPARTRKEKASGASRFFLIKQISRYNTSGLILPHRI